MNANTQKLHDLGQRLWLDNITRDLLASGTLARYIAELSVTGLTSNPTIFEKAIGSGASYDDSIRRLATRGLSDEGIFFELALQDLTQAADLFHPVFDASDGVDGWVSLEVSPLLFARGQLLLPTRKSTNPRETPPAASRRRCMDSCASTATTVPSDNFQSSERSAPG